MAGWRTTKDSSVDHNENHTFLKVFVAWIGTVYGSISLNDLVLIATLVFTVAQIFFTIRDRWWRDRVKRKREHLLRRESDL